MELIYVSFLVTTLAILVQTQDCSFNDAACEKAVSVAKAQSDACARFRSDGLSAPSMCEEDFLQLRKRFTVVLVNSRDFEDTCNPCGPNGTGGSQCQSGVPLLPASCPDVPVFDRIIDENEFDVSRFIPKFNWHQDANVQIGSKGLRRQCCVTTKRTIPFLGQCGYKCYLVFCPFSGGYQWRDNVKCGVTQADVDSGILGQNVKTPSRIKCKKLCRKNMTHRRYLVTNLPPLGWFGHCSYIWLPVWFKRMSVPTHCSCPRI